MSLPILIKPLSFRSGLFYYLKNYKGLNIDQFILAILSIFKDWLFPCFYQY